ncbi:MAG: DUF423 domain-containing protein [Bacteroidia bacterium]|nr:DUF423 domain-containing protein [Bacteroidia bacterium]MBT8267768.1 DUF423 domain-containing protein [Bacteroidia bacterium]NNL79468.1 DUF423 domain-containing protein [Flavobacteriaceae bacterium]
MNKIVLISAVILALLSVVLGAFAAHGLKPIIPSEAMDSFQTGVRYQMYHALALLVLGFTDKVSVRMKKRFFVLVVIGVLLFSGSIYGLSTNDLTSFDFKTIGFITPIGGSLLILSWILLLVYIVKNRFDKI